MSSEKKKRHESDNKKNSDNDMPQVLAGYCGLVCTNCPAYQATMRDDEELRRSIAEQWSQEFDMDLDPDSIHCCGCTAEKGRHISNCDVCEIRLCARERKLATCAECPDYMCERLREFVSVVPEAHLLLEELRSNLPKNE